MRIQYLCGLLAASVAASTGCANQTTTFPNLFRGADADGNPTYQSGLRSNDLLYAGGIPESYILSYPGGKLVAVIEQESNSPCVDSQDDVLMPAPSNVFEYRHGATKPFATLSLGNNEGFACAVDPSTNDIAVTLGIASQGDSVAVFANGTESSVLYPVEHPPLYCGYDDSGDLFVDGYGTSETVWLAELRHGSSSFVNIILNRYIASSPGQIAWDGHYITVQADNIIYRLTVKGSNATIVGQTTARGIVHQVVASSIYENRVIMTYVRRGAFISNIGIWEYPKGGKPVKLLRSPAGKKLQFTGVVVSPGYGAGPITRSH